MDAAWVQYHRPLLLEVTQAMNVTKPVILAVAFFCCVSLAADDISGPPAGGVPFRVASNPNHSAAPGWIVGMTPDGHVPFTVNGTWNVLPAVTTLIRQFEQRQKSRFVNYLPADSDQIVSRLSRRDCDVGTPFDSFIPEKDRKAAEKFERFPIARFVVGVVVNAKGPVRSVTTEELQRIFIWTPVDLSYLPPPSGLSQERVQKPVADPTHGAITSWKDIANSGSGAKIEFYRPNALSVATRVFGSKVYNPKGFVFLDLMAGWQETASRERRTDSLVISEVAKERAAIGFVAMRCEEQLDKRVRLLKIADNKDAQPVAPSLSTVANGSYPIMDTVTLYMHPDAPPEAKEFCEFVTGPEGAKIIKQCGLWPEYELDKVRGEQRLAAVKAGKGTEIAVCDLTGWGDILNDMSLEFVKAKAAVRLRFDRGQGSGVRGKGEVDAAVALLNKGEIELLLAEGKDEGGRMKDEGDEIQNLKSKIQNLKSVELARLAVGVVVHPENPLESLPLDEARGIFCGEVKKWPAVRGSAPTIHVFGLRNSHPITQLLKEKLLGSALTPALSHGERGSGGRKSLKYSSQPDSEKVLAAVAHDPAAIGFVDLSQLPPGEKSVKLVSVVEGKGKDEGGRMKDEGKGDSPIFAPQKLGQSPPNPLSRTFTLYVSPKASQTAKDFAGFLTPAHCKETIAQYNLLPPLDKGDSLKFAAPARVVAPELGQSPGAAALALGEVPLLLDAPDAPKDQGPAESRNPSVARSRGVAEGGSKAEVPTPDAPEPAKLASAAQPMPEMESRPVPKPASDGRGFASLANLSDRQTMWAVGGIGGVMVLAMGIGWLRAPKRKKLRK